MNKAKTRQNLHVKRGDSVVIVAGKDKGKVGTVKEAFPKNGTIVVEGVNTVTKAVKPNPMKGVQGGLIQLEAPIHSSKAMLYCLKCEKATRIRHAQMEDGSKTRVCIHCNEQLDV
jgi:large subunit ribosomal protein L24